MRFVPRLASIRRASSMLQHQMAGERYALLRYGGGGAKCTLTFGTVRFHHPAAHDLIRMLPPVIRVDAVAALKSEWMQSTLKLMAAEARQKLPGGETIVTRLADTLVIQAIRTWLQRDPDAKTEWLRALQDGRSAGRSPRFIANQGKIGRWGCASRRGRHVALGIHGTLHHPGRANSHALRDQRANAGGERKLTRGKGLTIEELAARLGSQSEAAFNHTFKRLNGITPGASRRLNSK